MPPEPPLPWTADLGLRFRRLFLLKLAGTTAWTWAFFVAYFHLLRHPMHPVTVMPLTALDHWVPFQPAMLFPYLSLWLYVGVAPGLQRSFAELLAYGAWAGALCLAGLAVFRFWPTAVPPLGLDVSGFAGFRMLQGVDASGNACPSMHVAIAIFTMLRLEAVWREARAPWPLHALNVAWFALIAWSTLAVKQHVVIDVLAGAALGGVLAGASLRWRPARGQRARADIMDRMPADLAP